MEIINSLQNDSLVAMAMTRSKDVLFDPWSLPDSFTVYNFAPDYVRPFLHPHWQTQKAPHPMIYYFLGLFYLFIGISSFIPSANFL